MQSGPHPWGVGGVWAGYTCGQEELQVHRGLNEHRPVEGQQVLPASLLAALLFLFHVKYSIHSYSYVLQ